MFGTDKVRLLLADPNMKFNLAVPILCAGTNVFNSICSYLICLALMFLIDWKDFFQAVDNLLSHNRK
jgi:hypothetical protein